MTTSSFESQPQPVRDVGRSFYLGLSLAMAAVFVGGFSRTVPDDFLGTPALPLLLHIHGAVFTVWVLLFVAQPALIARGSIRLHRRIGWAGAGLAVAMVVMGIAATLFAVRHRAVPPFFPATVFLVMNVIGILAFGALVAAGVRLRRRPAWHKRLMLCATISILGPGLGRLLPMPSFGAAAPLVMFGAILSFAIAGMMADLIVRHRIHPAYIWGTGVILLTDLAIGPLALASQTAALVAMIQSS
jgi:hypothetical protein